VDRQEKLHSPQGARPGMSHREQAKEAVTDLLNGLLVMALGALVVQRAMRVLLGREVVTGEVVPEPVSTDSEGEANEDS
jgi:hypothetical protein